MWCSVLRLFGHRRALIAYSCHAGDATAALCRSSGYDEMEHPQSATDLSAPSLSVTFIKLHAAELSLLV